MLRIKQTCRLHQQPSETGLVTERSINNPGLLLGQRDEELDTLVAAAAVHVVALVHQSWRKAEERRGEERSVGATQPHKRTRTRAHTRTRTQE